MTTEPIDVLIADHHRRYASEYGGGLSDHGPMVLLAMQGLDLPEARIRAFHDHYVARLEPARAADVETDAATYPHYAGQPQAYPALLEFFIRAIETDGVHDTVNHYLPPLLPGWASAAFHPLIRLGYGLEFAVTGEVAAGLAYAACLGPHPDLVARAAQCMTRAPIEPLAAANALTLPPDFNVGVGIFQPRLTRALQSGELSAIGPPIGGIEAIAATCREIFAASHDFFALHLVTGTHALRVCLEQLDEVPPEAEALAICGVLAAYLAVGAPDFPSTASVDRDIADFDPHSLLVQTRDEHDIKVAYSCQAQAAAYDDTDYLAAARGYLGRRA